jgi:hypothetical protein
MTTDNRFESFPFSLTGKKRIPFIFQLLTKKDFSAGAKINYTNKLLHKEAARACLSGNYTTKVINEGKKKTQLVQPKRFYIL